MTIVLHEASHVLPLVSVAVAFRSGRIHDPPGLAGLARIHGRMLRRGCTGYDADGLEERVDALGGELGVGVGLGSSSVSFEVLKRSLGPFIELVATVISQPTFDEKELQRLKRQTVAEIIEARTNDSLLAGRALRRELFADHPHGSRVTGSCESVGRIERDDVTAFHRRHVTRQNAVVTICGDVTLAEAQRIAERLTAPLPEGEPVPYPAEQPSLPPGRRLVVVDKPGRSQSQVVFGTLGTCAGDDDHTALLVANTAFGGTFTSRLTQQVRCERGWSYVASSHLSIGRIREAFTMWTAPAAADTAACIKLQVRLLEQWCDQGIDEAELSFCQQNLRRSYAFAIDTAKKRVMRKLERELLSLPDGYHDRFIERVEAVTLEAANEALKRRIDTSRFWVSAVATDSVIGDEIRAAIPSLAGHKVVRYDLE